MYLGQCVFRHTPAISAIGAGVIVAGLTISAFGFGGNNGTTCPRQVGPDVIVGDIQGVANFTAEEIPLLSGNWFDAFSFGTTSCNVGNLNVAWIAYPSNLHPAIAQSLYKFKIVNGATRFEQLGQSWLKHGFAALTENICGCGCNNQGGSVLGVGCSDPYTAVRNASQGGLGPKWQVDASSGYFPDRANPPWSGTTARRLRVRSADLESSSASVRYFAECQYVTQDDAAWGNKNNNASYREASIFGGPLDWTVTTAAFATVREGPALSAWKAADLDVTLTNVIVPESPNPLALDPTCCTSALVIIGAKATDLGGGLWHYEYAIQNLNSHRSIASFSVPLSGQISISNIGFHDVAYHSSDGEGSVNRDGTDWAVTQTSTEIKWETIPFATNPNSNALRWGTTYNFRFDANTPPTSGDVTLGTYRVVGSLSAVTVIPSPTEPPPPPCPADITGDQQVNVNDLLTVINNWGACPKPPLNCDADITGDDQVNVNDLLMVINNWGKCPKG